MADKISTIVLKVDLECERCYKKIRKVLCKIQDKMNIKTISFDEKANTVTISGPFNADEVCNKLCCKAGRVIKQMDVKGAGKAKEGGGDKPKDAGKPAGEKDAGKAAKEGGKGDKDGGAKAEKKEEKAEKKEEKAEKKEGGKGDKDAKADKGEKKDGGKDAKAEAKKVKFDLDGGAPAADAKPGKAMAMPPGMTKADLGPLLEKMMAAKAAGGPEAPRGEPIAPPPTMAPGAAQGVAVPSIWPAPAGSVAGYGYNPGYDYSAGAGAGGYGGGYGYGYGGCGCGGYNGYCRCGKPAAPPSGYYGVPVYDSQGWYYGAGAGARQPYYPQPQQHCCEDPNAGCSVM